MVNKQTVTKVLDALTTAIVALLVTALIFLLTLGIALADTIIWSAPTQNTDGTALTNLAGYDILYGSSPTALDLSVTIANPAATTAVIDPPAPGTWYYVVRAFNSTGVRSDLSPVVNGPDNPAPPPPAGMSVVGREVYQIVQQTDRLVFLPVGTVTTPMACIATFPVGPYYVVPRAATQWYGGVKPKVVVTKCN